MGIEFTSLSRSASSSFLPFLQSSQPSPSCGRFVCLYFNGVSHPRLRHPRRQPRGSIREDYLKKKENYPAEERSKEKRYSWDSASGRCAGISPTQPLWRYELPRKVSPSFASSTAHHQLKTLLLCVHCTSSTFISLGYAYTENFLDNPGPV